MNCYKITGCFNLSGANVLVVRANKNNRFKPGFYRIEKHGRNKETLEVLSTYAFARSLKEDEQALSIRERIISKNLDQAYLYPID